MCALFREATYDVNKTTKRKLGREVVNQLIFIEQAMKRMEAKENARMCQIQPTAPDKECRGKAIQVYKSR